MKKKYDFEHKTFSLVLSSYSLIAMFEDLKKEIEDLETEYANTKAHKKKLKEEYREAKEVLEQSEQKIELARDRLIVAKCNHVQELLQRWILPDFHFFEERCSFRDNEGKKVLLYYGDVSQLMKIPEYQQLLDTNGMRDQDRLSIFYTINAEQIIFLFPDYVKAKIMNLEELQFACKPIKPAE